jgi:predicted membrane protein
VYEHGGGPAVLDLSQVRWGTKDKRITVRNAFGPLLVVVPNDVPVDVASRMQAGQMNLFGRRRAGWSVALDVREPGDADLGTLHLNLQMNFGEIDVRRVRPSDAFVAGHDRRGTRVNVDVWRGIPRVEVGPGDDR